VAISGVILAESVLSKADQRHGFCRFRGLPGSDVEELPGFTDQAIAEERAPDLQHQLQVVLVAEVENATERA
jgi:hypothetical protein